MAPARKVPKLHNKSVAVKSGTKFVDGRKQEFTVGKEIGQGGFGRIYEGVQAGSRLAVAIKMEPPANGPLFTEMHVYMRVLKLEHLEKWKKEKDIKFLGLPHFISNGSFTYEGQEIRTLVIPKYALSLESVRAARTPPKLSWAETSALAKSVLYSLAYLHDQNYVHGDVKAANLMMNNKTDFSSVYLIDFGLARRLPDALVEKENKKQAHNGTPLFTSCDAHRGCLPSFRGDLEILVHNMLYWLTGTLPWEAFEQKLDEVYEAKKALLADARREVPRLLANEHRRVATSIAELYTHSASMEFGEKMELNIVLQVLAGR
uniref:non-specific serine/threonine protein kinase n=1 Tax=Globodera pallida TaxID=36090 RepID=A0A183C9X2_GLOPA